MFDNGLFIAVEGADGAGKTTACQELKRLFEAKGCTVLVTRQPGGTALTTKIREILVNEDPSVEAIHPKAQILLFLADRIQHIHHTILPALARGEIVITDRFIDSTMVYQGLMKQKKKILLDLYKTQGFTELCIRPDYTLFLDVSKEESIARSKHRGLNGLDKIHQEAAVEITEVWRDYMSSVACLKLPTGLPKIHSVEEFNSVLRELVNCMVESDNIQKHFAVFPPYLNRLSQLN
jgi:dTMP kinase